MAKGAVKKEKFEYEFFGPIGALGVTVLTTVISFGSFYICNEEGCPAKFSKISHIFKTTPLFDQKSLILYLLWFSTLTLLWKCTNGKWAKGTPIDDKGTRLLYKINGFNSACLILGVVCTSIYLLGASCMEFIWDNFLQLMFAAYVFSVVLCTFCYVQSFFGKQQLAKGGTSGNILFDWFIGRSLNPRIGNFDIKCFCELRPGLILWVVFDIAFACHQYLVLGGRITDSMVLVIIFHTWYVLDSLINESAVLTTMDITTDGFGYMLSFGDLVWVPFLYSLQARYLAFHPVDLGLVKTLAILCLQFLGYYIFRGANGQKNRFRSNPNDSKLKHLKFIQTKRGTKLLTSGWWGMARHINYFGDWIMAWAWCLPAGFGSPIPYFYVAYFGVLLVHRNARDDHKCRVKYGEDWEKYCKAVKYRIIPYVY